MKELLMKTFLLAFMRFMFSSYTTMLASFYSLCRVKSSVVVVFK